MTQIASSDVLFKLSAPNANSGNSLAGYPGTSWGGWLSTTLLQSVALDNLFNDITGPANAAGQVDYACLFIQNNTATNNSMMNVIAWIPQSSLTGSGSSIAAAVDPTGVTAVNSNSQQALIINSSIIAPAGVSTWVSPTNSTPVSPSYTNGLQLGNIAPGQCIALWLRRTALDSASPTQSSFQLEIMFSSGS